MTTDYIPMDKWGKDHWSTLAYLETCAVDECGKINNARMRCHPRLHRNLVGILRNEIIDGSKYPTRLKNNETVERHDDWSCVEDMINEELLDIELVHVRKSKLFGGYEATVTFTETGLKLAAQLRAHKANGGNYAEFTPRKEFA